MRVVLRNKSMRVTPRQSEFCEAHVAVCRHVLNWACERTYDALKERSRSLRVKRHEGRDYEGHT